MMNPSTADIETQLLTFGLLANILVSAFGFGAGGAVLGDVLLWG
jgi:hypothetical protein